MQWIYIYEPSYLYLKQVPSIIAAAWPTDVRKVTSRVYLQKWSRGGNALWLALCFWLDKVWVVYLYNCKQRIIIAVFCKLILFLWICKRKRTICCRRFIKLLKRIFDNVTVTALLLQAHVQSFFNYILHALFPICVLVFWSNIYFVIYF